MSRPHDVVLGLRDRAEGGQSAVLTDGRKLGHPPGEDLVRICLVADVPEDLVPGGVEQAVEGDGYLAGTQVRPEVPPDLADHIDDVGPKLFGQLLELGIIEVAQVGRSLDLGKQGAYAVGVRIAHLSRSWM